jgi:hypothetical protein
MKAVPFSVRNRKHLRRLFTLLDVPFSENDPALNATTVNRLWYTEHRALNEKYSDERLLEVLDIAREMGMLDESLPRTSGGWQRVLIQRIRRYGVKKLGLRTKSRMNNPGGTVRAMMKRFKLYQRLELTADEIGPLLCWAGQRLRELKMGETVPELIELVKRENPAVLDDPWFQAQIALNDENPDRYRRPFATETEIMILCAKLVYGGQLTLARIEYVDDEQPMIDDVPSREVLYYVFTRPGRHDIIVYNGAAVERMNGDKRLEPRPTLASTAREVMLTFGFAGRQGLMVSNPHSERLAGEAVRITSTNFRVFGIAAPDMPDLAAELRMAKTVLGEVARTLHQETKYSES